MFKKLAMISLSMLFAASPLFAKKAYCTIVSGNEVTFDGYCDFQSEKGGSFYLSSLDGSPLMPSDETGIVSVSVEIFQKGVADVRGLTTDGINSRWGEATRSRTDPACWVGSDFKVCAR